MKVKTALGKTLDMGSLIAKNEKMRAVGNMKVNARGDTIDGNNRVIVPANEKVANSYAKTVGNRSSHIQEKKKPPTKVQQATQLTKEDLEIKKSLDEFDSEDAEIDFLKGKTKNNE